MLCESGRSISFTEVGATSPGVHASKHLHHHVKQLKVKKKKKKEKEQKKLITEKSKPIKLLMTKQDNKCVISV